MTDDEGGIETGPEPAVQRPNDNPQPPPPPPPKPDDGLDGIETGVEIKSPPPRDTEFR
jgi:hypothetical protein